MELLYSGATAEQYMAHLKKYENFLLATVHYIVWCKNNCVQNFSGRGLSFSNWIGILKPELIFTLYEAFDGLWSCMIDIERTRCRALLMCRKAAREVGTIKKE